MPGIVCIDLDGTLIPRTSVSLYLACHFGQENLLAGLEDKFIRGLISNSEIATQSAAALSGRKLDGIEAILGGAPIIDGVEETLAAFRSLGCQLLLCTITWSFAARYFARRFGFDQYCGTVMAESNGCLDGRITRHFNEYDKLAFVEAAARSLGAPMASCLAVGDSRSDVPLFGKAGFSVAINASPEARTAATVAIDTTDLRDVLPFALPFFENAQRRA